MAYFAGNSLGLRPRATRVELLEDLDAWAALGVEGHLDAARPWLPYHELLTGPASRLVGALPSETVVMNSLTVNLHLLMVSFYRPTRSAAPDRHRGLGLPLGQLRRPLAGSVPWVRRRRHDHPPAAPAG